MRAGASRDATKRILKKIRGHIYRGVETKDIYKLVLSALSEEGGQALKQRYQLKEAIMKLGSEGYLFENFVGEILKHSGFDVRKIRSKVKGECILHEIDLVVYEKNKRILVECKHRSKHGSYTGLKESMYTHARFLDTRSHFDAEFLVCNTKVSNYAKKYAKCIGQTILSWRHPHGNSLENLVERSNLYPITILNLTSRELKVFLDHGFLLIKELLDYSEIDLSKKTRISIKRIQNLQNLTRQIMS